MGNVEALKRKMLYAELSYNDRGFLLRCLVSRHDKHGKSPILKQSLTKRACGDAASP
jgi:hypothetical protein